MRSKRRKPAIMVIGAPFHCVTQKETGSGTRKSKSKSQRRQKTGLIASCDQNTARVLFLHGYGDEIRKEDMPILEKVITRCSAVLLLQNVVVGVVEQTASLARKHGVKVMIDPEPMLELTEKIRRVAELITSKSLNSRKRYTSSKKWRKRRSS
jgi:sugar/nucleoside kinase (ribokinase family)